MVSLLAFVLGRGRNFPSYYLVNTNGVSVIMLIFFYLHLFFSAPQNNIIFNCFYFSDKD